MLWKAHGMSANDDRPQIGYVEVDPDALTLPGASFDAVIAPFATAQPEGSMLAGLPTEGWRVLDRPERGGAIIGVPADDSGGRWWIGQISPGRDGVPARLGMQRDAQPLRRSKAERRAGLALRWPATTREEPDLRLLAVDIVNLGTERWRPDGDSFHVVGSLQRPDEAGTVFYYAYVGGTDPALPLDPGEYVRTRVSLENTTSWDDLEPGRYEVRAALLDLGLRPDPLPIDVTEEMAQARRATERARPSRFPPPPPPPPPRHP